MKRIVLSSLLVCAVITIFLPSCKGKKKEAGKPESPAIEMVTPAPANTIITTPQSMVIIMHKVANYDKWKQNYDAHNVSRLESGLHNYVIGRGLYDSNMVVVALRADDLQKARTFAASADLKNAMQKGGVKGPVTSYFVEATWQDTANVGSLLRSITTFNVKDWNAWQQSFDEGKQERVDNGILTRIVGHDADNDKKIKLVTALSDTARAFTYYKSDALKKRREAGGVIGEPTRFVFHIAQRY